MATNFVRLSALAQAYANLVAAQNNMLANILILQQAQTNGTLTVTVAKAFNDLGTAFAQRFAQVQAVLTANDPTSLGIAAADIAALAALLGAQATALSTATPVTPADVATLVSGVQAAVPATISAFATSSTLVPDVPPAKFVR